MGACACAGATCEDVMAPCAGSPCKNGGECRESEDYESFSCSCPSGWQGRGMAHLGVQHTPLSSAARGAKDGGEGAWLGSSGQVGACVPCQTGAALHGARPWGGPDLPHGSAGWMGCGHHPHPLVIIES